MNYAVKLAIKHRHNWGLPGGAWGCLDRAIGIYGWISKAFIIYPLMHIQSMYRPIQGGGEIYRVNKIEI